MPIDPSIPLQAQPLKLESPMNQLAMAGEIMKLGEYKQASEERNFLRNRMAKGDFNIADPAHRQEVMAGAPTVGGKFLADTASMQRNLYQGEKARNEIDTSNFDRAINHTINEPNAEAASKTIMQGMANKTIPMDKGQSMLEELKTTPFAAWTTKTLKGLVGAREQFVQAAQDKRSQASLAQSDSHFKQRLAQETATGTLTPQTTDLLAQTYIQTGVLPSMGMGKTATAMRQNVLNRAAEMTMGAQTNPDGTAKPMPTAAEAATNIAENKQNIASQAKAVKDFSTGIQGRQVNSFNTAINHLDTMEGFATALQNGDTKAVNVIANQIAKQTGAPAPTTFDAAKRIVSAEIVKTIVANGGGVKERDEAANDFSAANSPAQLKSVMNSYKELMGGQLKSLNLQYENTTGRKDFDKKLTPAAKKSLSNLRSEGGGSMPSSGAIDMLKQNPALAPEYDAKFGAGAAAKVLGK